MVFLWVSEGKRGSDTLRKLSPSAVMPTLSSQVTLMRRRSVFHCSSAYLGWGVFMCVCLSLSMLYAAVTALPRSNHCDFSVQAHTHTHTHTVIHLVFISHPTSLHPASIHSLPHTLSSQWRRPYDSWLIIWYLEPCLPFMSACFFIFSSNPLAILHATAQSESIHLLSSHPCCLYSFHVSHWEPLVLRWLNLKGWM